MGIDAVIFDWGGTLTPFHTVDFPRVWAGVGEALVRDGAQGTAAELAAALLEAENGVWARITEHRTSLTLDHVFEEAGVEPTESALRALFDAWTPHTYTDPDVPGLLAALRERGIAVGVLSNTTWPRAWHEEIFDRDGVLHLIDGAVYTSEIAWSKPHPEAFRAAMAAVAVTDPGSCVFVGDQLVADIEGAKETGMRTVHVPHSTGFPAGRHRPDAVVQRLAEVLPLVDAWATGPAAPRV